MEQDEFDYWRQPRSVVRDLLHGLPRNALVSETEEILVIEQVGALPRVARKAHDITGHPARVPRYWIGGVLGRGGSPVAVGRLGRHFDVHFHIDHGLSDGSDWREELVALLQDRFNQGNDAINAQVRPDRAYFAQNGADVQRGEIDVFLKERENIIEAGPEVVQGHRLVRHVPVLDAGLQLLDHVRDRRCEHAEQPAAAHSEVRQDDIEKALKEVHDVGSGELLKELHQSLKDIRQDSKRLAIEGSDDRVHRSDEW